MLFSQTGTYAVRAAIHLAEAREEGTVNVSTIAESIGVPKNYLSKILHQLARAGLLASERGPHGGFRLAREPREISLAAIVEASEARRPDRRCLLGRPECTDADPCPAHDGWKALAERINGFLHDTTLADLCREGGKG